MAVNRGLLWSAAVANGLNAFLDAREKGDIQRQQKAMTDIKKQAAQLELQNLDLRGQQYSQEIKDYPIQQRADREYRKRQAETAGTRAEANELAQKRMYETALKEDAPKPPKLHEKIALGVLEAAGLGVPGDPGFSQGLIDALQPGSEVPPYVQQVIIDISSLTGANMANIKNTAQYNQQVRQQEAHDVKIDQINQDAENKKKLKPGDIINLQKFAAGDPQLAAKLVGLKTMDQAVSALSSPEFVNAILSRQKPYFHKAGDGSLVMIDLYNPDDPNPITLQQATPGLEQLKPSDIMALTAWPQKLAERFKTRPVTRYYDRVKNGYEAMNVVAKQFMEKRITAGVFDLTLANQFRKLLDPPSVVRNSENEAVKRAMGFMQQVEATIIAFPEGGNFQQSMRVSIMNAISSLMEGTNVEFNRSYQEEARLVEYQMGVTESFKPRISPEAWEHYKFDVETVLGKPPISPVDNVPTYSKPVDVSGWIDPEGGSGKQSTAQGLGERRRLKNQEKVK